MTDPIATPDDFCARRSRWRTASGRLADVDDLERLRAWQAGDAAAGSALFERHFGSVVRFVKNKVANLAEVEDIVQQIFLACVEGRERFAQRSSFRTYLFSVARHKLYDHLRSIHGRGGTWDPQTTSIADLQPSPSIIVAKREEQRLVLDGLRRIPLEYQVVLELHYWESLTGAQIAEVLDVPEGTVRFRLRRGRQLLAEAIRRGPTDSALEAAVTGDLEGWAKSIVPLED
jgi:RNA polymerase sigma factor (sigma-70 family)